ncbi:lysophospholipid acyltransferase family protein [Photobacterium sp. TY1-4]|uniref:lysophospholipid acyltransferase family protein n=1 Tax=Photobacterium sp. TY1-4 TaxID=2899122 RepID=UPI0021BEA9EE|nr:lysophospholipid acyltransferase family protein [Photobacterium sp. TY1-4]UXI03314.1 lysophospholipid acyltransferase family protein [Photobacterium sp. TY1-4]
MINIERAVNEKFPSFSQKPNLIRKPTLSLLRKLVNESEINRFLDQHQEILGIDFIDAVFDYFNFSYAASSRDKENIPAQGRVVIIANHPLGSLDGLALLKLISEVRRDVRIVANDLLMNFSQLEGLFIPLDNLTSTSFRRSYKEVIAALNHDEAVIIFPAGEVSRTSPTGIKDGQWRGGFLNFARKTQSPVLPIHINGKNSALFYSASLLAKPLSTAMLAGEMFKQRNGTLLFRIGEMIPASELHSDQVADKALIKRLKKHLYNLGKARKPFRKRAFVTEKTVAHPEDRQEIRLELKASQLLGETRDNHRIQLCDFDQAPVVMREVGRLRELTFRKVGEGTGSKRDLDKYDRYYQHLILWDENRLEIAGAYRLGRGCEILRQYGRQGLYTDELFDYTDAVTPYLPTTVELGRSFVSPSYWGKASLDYLWQGIGAYLRHHPDVRYLIGPVTMSNEFPPALQTMLVYYYTRYYGGETDLAEAKRPYTLDPDTEQQLDAQFAGLDRQAGFELLQHTFTAQGCKVPVLFKQYASLFEDGGFRLITFSVDPDFGNCIDGLFMADLTQMKPAKRKRYLGE